MGYDGTLTQLENGKTTDITPKELQAIEVFKEAGMPGVASLGDIKMTKALDLYLSGKTYHEVASILTVKKDIVLYLAQKFNWYDTKINHLEILDASLKERILHAKLVNQDFVLQIQQFYLHKIGRKINKFMATNDEEVANSIDGKDIDRYTKTVELLQKMTDEKIPGQSRGPTVGLNLGDGVTVKKVGENEVTITPRNKTVGEMLKDLANLKREEDNTNKNITYDIDKEVDKQTEGKET